MDSGRDCIDGGNCYVVDDSRRLGIVRQTAIPHRLRPNCAVVRRAGCSRFLKCRHEITYNGGEGLVFATVWQTVGRHPTLAE